MTEVTRAYASLRGKLDASNFYVTRASGRAQALIGGRTMSRATNDVESFLAASHSSERLVLRAAVPKTRHWPPSIQQVF